MSEAEKGELWRQILPSFVGYTIFFIHKLLINDKKKIFYPYIKSTLLLADFFSTIVTMHCMVPDQVL